ncbi:serine/threonine-protein kinase [Streptomyces vinaceus]|uniref:serine/threonine-protein kinase n=1 Tax=Streptomyces vinaceus TaxID=1960 RepID=UPI00367BAA56
MEKLRPGDPRRIGPFEVLARVGGGGMGTVYLASRGSGDDLVAVKVVKSEHAQDQDFQRRFTREVAAASRIRDPHTVRVIGFDVDAAEPWLATEYVQGPSLREQVRQKGPLPLTQVIKLGLGLATGLTAIHGAGLVHRDLKPGNVLLAEDGPKIIDFGLAYAHDFSSVTPTGAMLGTPGYFAPEQVEGLLPLGPAADVFALGAVLAYASSGSPPFGQGEYAVLAYRVTRLEPDLSAVPQGLRELTGACLAKDPDHRPSLHETQSLLATLWFEGPSAAAIRGTRPPDKLPVSTGTSNSAPASKNAVGPRVWATAGAAATVVVLLAIGFTVLWPESGDTGRTAAGESMRPPSSSPSLTPSTSRSPTPSPSPSVAPVLHDEYTRRLISSLQYDPAQKGCVMDSSAPLRSADGYGITVTPLEKKGDSLSRARITVHINSFTKVSEPTIIHVTFPKGEDTYLTMPDDHDQWSFTWPDQVVGQVPYAMHRMKSEAVSGPYTVVIVRGSIQGCNGFMGDIRDGEES